MKFFIALSILASLALAKVEVVGYAGKPTSTPKGDFKDDESLMGLSLQYYTTKNLALGLRGETSKMNKFPDGSKTDLERGSLNLEYDFFPEDRIRPYIMGGAGYEKLHRTYLKVGSQAFHQAGLGLKVGLTKKLDLVTEARYLKKKDGHDEFITSLGLGVKFGEGAKNSCKKVEPKPVRVSAVKAKKVSKVSVVDNKQKLEADNVNKNDALVFSDEKVATSNSKVKVSKSAYKVSNYIQVAALSKKTNVTSTVSKLKRKGLKVKTIRKLGSTVVLVGPYEKSKITHIYRVVKKIQKDAFYKKL